MSIRTICLLEIVCLIVDLFYFHAAISHILFICLLIALAFCLLFKDRKKAVYAIVTTPLVAIFSATGYLIDLHTKNIVSAFGSTCFEARKCDLPQSYLSYRIRPVYKADGRAKDMIIIDGYNHSFLTFDPMTRTFERSEM